MPQDGAWLAYVSPAIPALALVISLAALVIAALTLLIATLTYSRAGPRVTVWYLQDLDWKDFWATLRAGGDDFGEVYIDIVVRNSGQAPAEISNFVLARATLLRGGGHLDVSTGGAAVLVEGPDPALPAQLAGGNALWYRYQVKSIMRFERGSNPRFSKDFWDLAYFTRCGSLTVALGSGREVTWKRSWSTELLGPDPEHLALHSRRMGKLQPDE